MGIDLRFTTQIAARFRDRQVLETCTGGGFTTIALANAAAHVITESIAIFTVSGLGGPPDK
jgi:predicted methyltransferase